MNVTKLHEDQMFVYVLVPKLFESKFALSILSRELSRTSFMDGLFLHDVFTLEDQSFCPFLPVLDTWICNGIHLHE